MDFPTKIKNERRRVEKEGKGQKIAIVESRRANHDVIIWSTSVVVVAITV